MVKETRHYLDTYSSRNNLIFTSQPNLMIDSGIHTALYSNCHHQIFYAKFNLHIIYLPPYFHEVRQHKNANNEHIGRAINTLNWQGVFLNTSVSEKLNNFNSTILNIMSDFVSHGTIMCDNKDPTRFSNKIKTLIQEMNKKKF